MHVQKLKINPTKVIQNSVLNMNQIKSLKYSMSPEEIERRPLAGERFRVVFNMHRTEKIKNFMTDLIGMT